MTLGISDEHRSLHAAVRRWVDTHADVTVARAALDCDGDERPPFWDDLAKQGWLGLAIDERYGGEGYGLSELGVVLEELGRTVAPGPFLPTALAAVAIEALGRPEQADELLPAIVDGSAPAAVGFGAQGVTAVDEGESVRLTGVVRPVVGAGPATLVLVPEAVPAGRWFVLRRDEVEVTCLPSLDATRPVAEVVVDGIGVGPDRVLVAGPGDPTVEELAVALLGAECVGGAAWCVDAAAAYARERRQFGRPIGQFQAVKHRCADMLAALEAARAAAWDAARPGDRDELRLARGVAAAVVPDAYFAIAQDCIQVHGGIGFTWEHDAHLYLKRAAAIRQLLGSGSWHRGQLVEAVRSGARRSLSVDLPDEAVGHRAEVEAFVDDLRQHDKAAWNRRIADAGYLVPNWPRPWGRAAGPVEQLVIEEVFRERRVRRAHLAVGAWALPTIIAHGTPEQQERWIPPTLRGEVTWCQMFSEPGAGSDLAALTTRAERVEGGWSLTGQKVWTTLAHQADWGICLARTDPDVPKHEGITCFVIDMRAAGLDIRPLRELTGDEMFNEVFLDEVFVPDDCVVGEVDGGWEAARTTLANERVSMGSGSSMGPGVEALLDLAARRGVLDDALVVDELGSILADAHTLAVLGLRMTLRALAGAEPGSESSVRKLLGVLHDQRVQEVGLSLLGSDAVITDGEAGLWIHGFLGNRALSIAGGTSEIQRNVIAERLLDLPKDP